MATALWRTANVWDRKVREIYSSTAYYEGGLTRGCIAHWPDCSRDILQVLSHFGITRQVIGIGHSFGGGIL